MVKIPINSEVVKLGIDIWYTGTYDFQKWDECPNKQGEADYICPMPHKHCGLCD